jgi:hypothetical protein
MYTTAHPPKAVVRKEGRERGITPATKAPARTLSALFFLIVCVRAAPLLREL